MKNHNKLQTFNEALEFWMFDHALLHVDFQGQQDGVHELVFLVQTPGRVLEHLERQELNDVHDSFGGDR